MPTRCGVGVLLFRSHVHDDRLRRRGAAKTVENPRSDRGHDGHSHGRPVRGPLLRDGQPDLLAPSGRKEAVRKCEAARLKPRHACNSFDATRTHSTRRSSYSLSVGRVMVWTWPSFVMGRLWPERMAVTL